MPPKPQKHKSYTPGELADRLERIAPGHGWPYLIGLLRWQQQTGRRPINIAWYAECAYRKLVEPRVPVAGAVGREQVKVLVQGIGKPA